MDASSVDVCSPGEMFRFESCPVVGIEELPGPGVVFYVFELMVPENEEERAIEHAYDIVVIGKGQITGADDYIHIVKPLPDIRTVNPGIHVIGNTQYPHEFTLNKKIIKPGAGTPTIIMGTVVKTMLFPAASSLLVKISFFLLTCQIGRLLSGNSQYACVILRSVVC